MDAFENLSWKMQLDFLAGILATHTQWPRKKKVLLDRSGVGCVSMNRYQTGTGAKQWLEQRRRRCRFLALSAQYSVQPLSQYQGVYRIR